MRRCSQKAQGRGAQAERAPEACKRVGTLHSLHFWVSVLRCRSVTKAQLSLMGLSGFRRSANPSESCNPQ